MKKGIVVILVVFALGVPGITYGKDVMYGELLLPTPADTGSQGSSPFYPKEWYIVEKIPTGKGLAIGVFLFEEGMSIEDIQSRFGKPKETITLDVEEGYYGTILVYLTIISSFQKLGIYKPLEKESFRQAGTILGIHFVEMPVRQAQGNFILSKREV